MGTLAWSGCGYLEAALVCLPLVHLLRRKQAPNTITGLRCCAGSRNCVLASSS